MPAYTARTSVRTAGVAVPPKSAGTRAGATVATTAMAPYAAATARLIRGAVMRQAGHGTTATHVPLPRSGEEDVQDVRDRSAAGMLPGVTMTEPVVPAAVADAAAALAEEQWRVATLVRSAEVRGRWDAVLDDDARWRLVRSGHFVEYPPELAWTPREVVGHLRDSARVFTDRLRRICTEDVPLLADFATGAPQRLADYRATPVEVLAEELRTAQAALLATVAGLGPADLERTARHETDGEVTVAALLRLLPAHERDHAEQLTALLAR